MGINISHDIDKSLNLSFNEYEMKMRDYAIENSVPIITDEGLRFLEDTIKKYNVKTILEIGTAIGYSAERISRANDVCVYTIERVDSMYNEALKNIKALGLSDKIHVIFKDALEAYPDVENVMFDALFIDAAKGQYKHFFELYEKNLKKGGIVICDNMSFHGFLDKDPSLMSRSLRGLVRKLRDFHDFLNNNPNYDTTYYEIGDGMSISIKK
ncbi:MAG: O-methyltransferase [Acholeplasmatales bacterium]|nr:O-methyltransferase [Acholeplasmatales bacterium]